MRIAITTNEFISEPNSYDGGIANYLYRFSLALKEFGHEPIIFLTSDKNDVFSFQGIEIHKIAYNYNFLFKFLDKVSNFKYLKLLNSLWNAYYVNKAIKGLHKQKRIDLIQFSSHDSNSLFAPSNIPSVLWMPGYIKFWNQADEIINKTICERQIEILNYWTHKRARAIYAPSHFLAKKVSEIIHKEIEVLETPYFYEVSKDNNELYESIMNQINGNKYFLYFGRLGVWKGTVELANILYDFLKENPETYMVLIGKNCNYKTKPIIDYVRLKTKEYSNRVIYHSNVPHDLLYPIIKGAYAIVLPSRIENVSNATIESMANKKIVLGTNGVSFEELITDSISGFLFNLMDEANLLNKMNVIMSLSDSQKAEIEENAYKRTLELRPEITVKAHIDFFQRNIIKQNPRNNKI